MGTVRELWERSGTYGEGPGGMGEANVGMVKGPFGMETEGDGMVKGPFGMETGGRGMGKGAFGMETVLFGMEEGKKGAGRMETVRGYGRTPYTGCLFGFRHPRDVLLLEHEVGHHQGGGVFYHHRDAQGHAGVVTALYQ